MTDQQASEDRLFPALSGERLLQRRRELELSAAQVSILCDLSLDQIYRMERGQRPFTAAVHLYRLAQALEKPMEYFIVMTDKPMHPWRNRRHKNTHTSRSARGDKE